MSGLTEWARAGVHAGGYNAAALKWAVPLAGIPQ